MVAKAWRLGGALADAVIRHHDYGEYTGKHKDLLYSIVAADYFASLMAPGVSGSPCLRKPEPAVWETLGIAPEDMGGIQAAVDDEIKNARIFLGR
jgi:hypothetical protein